MPKKVTDAKIALLDAAVEIEKTQVDAKIQITSPDQLQAFLDKEEVMLKDMVGKIVGAGANVVFVQKGIDDLAQHFLAKEGIYAIRRVKKSDMEKLSRATGARIVNSIHELSKDDLGRAGLVEAMEIIPKTLAENAGLDQIDSLVSLRSQHEKGMKSAGLNMVTGEPVDMLNQGVVEPLRVKTQAIQSAAEAAVMILRIDDVIASKSTPGGAGGPGGRPGGDMGGEDFD